MTDVVTPDRGSFCIAELNTADIEGARRFYGELFGWTLADVPGTDGGYLLFQLDGKDVAGLRRAPQGTHRWLHYVFVDSIADVSANAARLDATATPPVHVPGVASTCIIRDPEGSELGLWEAGGHQGARLIDVTNTMWWMELMTNDAAAARRFYTALFGWTFLETPKYGIPYTVFKIGEQSVAGATQCEPEWGVTAHWQVFFAVNDFADTVKRACAMGGSLGFWRDVPGVGRLGVIEDPGDASFIIMDTNQVNVPALS